jgi:chemotaxis protein methyltransferase CheR
MDDGSFQKILDQFSLSRKGYRKVRIGIKKRLSQHMQKLGCANVDEYIAALSLTPAIEKECLLLLTVSISRFFRDKRLWDHLENQILPQTIWTSEGVFRVWSCGCARGEEAYSFSMVWNRLHQAHPTLPDLELWATDVNPDYIEMARNGVYGISSLKELPQQFIERYFDKVPGKQRYILHSFLKQGIRFDRHDIVKHAPPAPCFDLVFLRNNLLTYYRPPEMEKALAAILSVLVPGGMLITGSHEKLPVSFDNIEAWPKHPWIYVKPQSDSCSVTG